MKQTRFTPDPKQPFGFHDCRINGIDIDGGNLKFSFEDTFYAIKEGAPEVRGEVIIEEVDPDFCEVIIQGRSGKAGGFFGKKLTLLEFTEKYRGFSFEVVDEYYGWHRMQFSGCLWMQGKAPKDMTVSIGYFKGDMVYNTEEVK